MQSHNIPGSFRITLAVVLYTKSHRHLIHQATSLLIALVWFINGFYCKLLNLVPRHQAIVAKILGEEQAGIITKMIGLSEIFMAVWIMSGIRSRLCSISQVFIIALMNTLEFFLAPELLLFGRGNSILAALLIGIILLNEYYFNRTQNSLAR